MSKTKTNLDVCVHCSILTNKLINMDLLKVIFFIYDVCTFMGQNRLKTHNRDSPPRGFYIKTLVSNDVQSW